MCVIRLDMTFLEDFMVKNRNFESFLAFLSILSHFLKLSDRGIFGNFLVQMHVTRVDITFLGDFMVKNRNFGSFLAFLSLFFY